MFAWFSFFVWIFKNRRFISPCDAKKSIQCVIARKKEERLIDECQRDFGFV